LRKCGLVIKDPLDFPSFATRIVSHSDIADAVAKPLRLSDQASFRPTNSSGPRKRDDGFLALLGYDGDFDFALS